MDAARSWSELTALLTDRAEVVSAVTLAITDPVGYFTDHAEMLSQRGIGDPHQVTGIIALIDALDEAGELAYLDWKTDRDEALDVLAELPRVNAAGIDRDSAADVAPGLESTIAVANLLLADHDVQIVMLDEDSDAYPLVAVPTERLPAVFAAAEQVDATVHLYTTPDGPSSAVAPAEAPPEPARGDTSLRDPRQTAEHYRALLDSCDVDSEISQLRGSIKMAVDANLPALAAHIKAGVGTLNQRLSARYALGVPVTDLIEDLRTLGNLWAELDGMIGSRWETPEWARSFVSMTRNADAAITAVHVVSWAVTLGERQVVEQVLSTYSAREAKLPVIGHLARMVGLDAPVDGTSSHVKLWQPWIDVVEADDENRQTKFELFVTTYPKGLNGVRRLVPPKDSGYSGRFAFEAAPLAIHYAFDDAALRDLPDYPKDLVDVGKNLR